MTRMPAMRDAGRSSRIRAAGREVLRTWRVLSPEQRVAGIAATLLVVSTFGPFSFVEAAIVLVAVAVLALLRVRAQGRRFHLPFGDGTVIAAAGAWCGLLIVVRVLDRPLGQNLLALGCALLLFLAGARERAKRPADDLPEDPEAGPPRKAAAPGGLDGEEATHSGRRSEATTLRLARRAPTRGAAPAAEPAPGGGGPPEDEDLRGPAPADEHSRGEEEATLPLADETRPLSEADTRPVPEDPPEMPPRRGSPGGGGRAG